MRTKLNKMTQKQKLRLDEIDQDEWNYSKRGEIPNKYRNGETSKSKTKDKSQHHSFSNMAEQDPSKRDSGLRDSQTPGGKNSMQQKLQLKIDVNPRSPSKNNSIVSQSARSNLKLTSTQRDIGLINHEIPKDKLFSPDEDLEGEFDARLEGGFTKNEWNMHATKPGVDRSEFYNPDAMNESFDNSKPCQSRMSHNHEDDKNEHPIGPKLNGQFSGPRNKNENKASYIEDTVNAKTSREIKNRGFNETGPIQVSERNNEFNKGEQATYEPEHDYQMTQTQKNKENTFSAAGDNSSEDIDHNDM